MHVRPRNRNLETKCRSPIVFPLACFRACTSHRKSSHVRPPRLVHPRRSSPTVPQIGLQTLSKSLPAPRSTTPSTAASISPRRTPYVGNRSQVCQAACAHRQGMDTTNQATISQGARKPFDFKTNPPTTTFRSPSRRGCSFSCSQRSTRNALPRLWEPSCAKHTSSTRCGNNNKLPFRLGASRLNRQPAESPMPATLQHPTSAQQHS